MYGGFEYIGATDVECKNYKRGLNEFIGERDAQMVVDKLLSRQEYFDNYSVEYKQDKESKELVGPALCSDTDFKRLLCGIIWTDRIEPKVFDEHWNKIMTDFELTEHKWLQDMFELRLNWIPAYFRHEPMSGLMRTTSRSETDYTTIHGVSVEAKYEVKYVPASCDIKCSCLKYECYGLLCRHIFYVLRLSKVFHFPRKYLQRRWSKYTLPNNIVKRPVDVASWSKPVECVNGVLREIYGTVEDSVTRLVTDIQKLHIYKADLDTLLEQVKIDIPNAPEMSKKELYAAALGVKEPETVNIVAPECRNKGSVSLKRHQTQAEIAMIQSNKPPRLCNYCDTYGYHDSRNCPKKKQIWMNKWPNPTTLKNNIGLLVSCFF
ncbi:zinc finger, SWIM-type, MULE transposase domain, FHY3/FAR1 family [Artemisia annua]|uniref:Zinc finger, SWIM-type, MULE transposase domain, FHY3/FAR1 family n=1 Tax=Artemisia annua TaxID=35608 RepID=A0A2U1M563_ARTAN|nr:zinc finger, SWIM-type, MULE transposase domain, FHY3/FAR1 family [Artemisia annua]